MRPWIGLDEGSLSAILVGDVNLRNVKDPHLPFALVQDALDGSDVCFANCEGCYSDPSVEIPYKSGWLHPDRAAVEGLACAGFDAVGCANNVHYGSEAILESLSHLDRLGIAHTGAGDSWGSARRPAIVETRGTRFGFLAYTSVFWPVGHAAGPEQAGVATIRAHTAYRPHHRVLEMPGAPAIVETWPDARELADMESDVRALRASVDILLVSCHWGVSGSHETVDYQRAVGRAAIDARADLVVGHHPHVPQGVEIYKERVIFYSLGNFMFGWEKMKAQHPEGLMVHGAVRAGKLAKVSAVPICRNAMGQPQIVSTGGREGKRIIQTVGALSASMGTELTVHEQEAVVWSEVEQTANQAP